MIAFLFYAVVISLSGVMAPGPVTAVTLAAGTRSRHAGALIALGHGVVEFPLVLLVMAGMSKLLEAEYIIIGIGLAGGLFLCFLGRQLLRSSNQSNDPAEKFAARNPLWIGIVLSAGNPYFLLWWVTVGLALTTQALQFGILAFGLFVVVHWLCDLVWLEALSCASFKGATLLSDRGQRIALDICSFAMILIGIMFIYDATIKLVEILSIQVGA